jgi:hypothetical protein
MADEQVIKEEIKVAGTQVMATVRQLLREGNVRRLTLKNEQGQVVLEVPLTFGVVGALLLPVWAAIGAVAVLAANLTIVVEKVDLTATAA